MKILGFVIGGSVIALGILIFVFFKNSKYRKMAKPLLDEEKELKSREFALEEDLHDADRIIRKILKNHEFLNIQSFLNARQEYRDLATQTDALNAQETAVLNGSNIGDVESHEAVLLTEAKKIKFTIESEGLNNLELSQEQYMQKQKEMERIGLEIAEASQNLTRAKTRVDDNNYNVDRQTVLEEKIAIVEQNLNFYQERVEVLDLVVDSLKEAAHDTAGMARDMVSEQIEKYLPVLTRRYKNARLTDKLEIEVFSDEKNDWLAPGVHLSQGTIDQIYFLTRLAFLKLITGNKKIPLILDDPFVAFDMERLMQVKQILVEVSMIIR
jgi:hypothetical protein